MSLFLQTKFSIKDSVASVLNFTPMTLRKKPDKKVRLMKSPDGKTMLHLTPANINQRQSPKKKLIDKVRQMTARFVSSSYPGAVSPLSLTNENGTRSDDAFSYHGYSRVAPRHAHTYPANRVDDKENARHSQDHDKEGFFRPSQHVELSHSIRSPSKVTFQLPMLQISSRPHVPVVSPTSVDQNSLHQHRGVMSTPPLPRTQASHVHNPLSWDEEDTWVIEL